MRARRCRSILGWLTVPVLFASCSRSQGPGASAGAGAGRASGARVAVIATTKPASDPKLTVPQPVGRALAAYAVRRLSIVPGLAPAADATVDGATQGTPACQNGPAESCLRAIATDSGTGMLVHATVERTAAESCQLALSSATLDGPTTAADVRSSRCRLQDLEAAMEDALRAIPAFRPLRASPPPPHAPCEDVCTGNERSCQDRATTVCGDSDWDGCTDWLATQCPASHGCSRGACIADKPEMVLIPEGPYLMGSGREQLAAAMALCQARNYGCVDSWWRPEQPAHWVYVSGFYVDRTEVTNAAYDECVRAGKCKKRDLTACRSWDANAKKWRVGSPPAEFGGPNKPAVCVTFDEAEKYCRFAGKRLPTEAEWEKAARGTDGRLYPWGNAAYDGSQGNGCDARCGEIAGPGWRSENNLDDKVVHVAEVGSYPAGASPHGALDLAGNVWEWVSDWFNEDYYKISERRDPRGPAPEAEKNFKVVRGGSWSNEPDSLRSSYRYSMDPALRMATIGFRCAHP